VGQFGPQGFGEAIVPAVVRQHARIVLEKLDVQFLLVLGHSLAAFLKRISKDLVKFLDWEMGFSLLKRLIRPGVYGVCWEEFGAFIGGKGCE